MLLVLKHYKGNTMRIFFTIILLFVIASCELTPDPCNEGVDNFAGEVVKCESHGPTTKKVTRDAGLVLSKTEVSVNESGTTDTFTIALNDKPDANDIYGMSKAKGEIDNNSSLTLRCSMIGREIYNHTELFEWLYSMKNKEVEGYANVIYSGVTTFWMGGVIKKILQNNTTLSGVYNISSEPISKYHLLLKLSNAFNLNINVSENSNIKSNKVLNSKKFAEITGIIPPNWDDLIPDFKNDSEKFTDIYKN